MKPTASTRQGHTAARFEQPTEALRDPWGSTNPMKRSVECCRKVDV